ncbi:unnamed protein product [Cuscuta campestris]|uniref:Endonuclease/exonuclease/phosphatase domain-containing protein n=1 Tax=Cuscuta campestris TaxID=132261 RepID=A0A484LLH6_9ASTE|nr:unnamed protein product [Cuscuta campestris]
MWKEEDLNYISHTDMGQITNILFFNKKVSKDFLFSAIYGKHTKEERKDLWEAIKTCSHNYHCDWILGGDFNAISSIDHHKGNSTPCLPSIQDFDDCVMDCGLHSPPYTGSPFTWTGTRSLGRLWKRLDRVFINSHCLNSFEDITSQHLPRGTSDHCPILLKASNPIFTSPRPFRYINCWSKNHTFIKVLEGNWGKYCGGGMKGLMDKLSKLSKVLQHWNKTTFGNITSTVEALEKDLQQAEQEFDANPTPNNRAFMNEKRANLIHTTKNEFLFWKQKAGIKWLKEGDCNSSFFHAKIKEKRIHQKIHRIKDSNGNWLENTNDIQHEATNFFKALFSNHNCEGMNKFLDNIPLLVDDSINTTLTKFPTEEEVKEAVWSLDPDSSAGPDGFTGDFYRQGWDTIKEDVIKAVQEFFLGIPIPKSMGKTTIILIP